MKDQIKTLPWKLIAILGLLALIRPAIKTIGSFMGFDVPPVATLSITAAIAVIWIVTVVALKVERPIYVLAAAGAIYAIVSILAAVVIQTITPGSGVSKGEEASIPVLLTVGLVASTLFNLVYGAFLGLIATAIQKILKK